MKKITKISVPILLLVLIFLFLQFFYWGPNWKKITDRCLNYDPEWSDVLDCYGIVSIRQRDNSGYLVSNNNHSGSIIAQIKESDGFTVLGDQMYFIDITPKGICNNLVPGKYCGNFQVKGETKTYYYDTPDLVPTYIVTNIKTGDQRFYVKVADAPTDERAVFEQLSNR